MGGRGTFAAGNNVPFTYETVDSRPLKSRPARITIGKN